MIFTYDAGNRFHRCGNRAMSVHDGRGTKPLPEKEISLEHRCQPRARRIAHTERQISSAREEAIRPDQAEGGSCHENHEDPSATDAVIACVH
jgi:hypothetical protein